MIRPFRPGTRRLFHLALAAEVFTGAALRRWLDSADFLSELATALALRNLNTPGSRSIASLCFITCADHFDGLRLAGRAAAEAAFFFLPRVLAVFFLLAIRFSADSLMMSSGSYEKCSTLG